MSQEDNDALTRHYIRVAGQRDKALARVGHGYVDWSGPSPSKVEP